MTLLVRGVPVALVLAVAGVLAGCQGVQGWMDEPGDLGVWEDNYTAGRVHPSTGG